LILLPSERADVKVQYGIVQIGLFITNSLVPLSERRRTMTNGGGKSHDEKKTEAQGQQAQTAGSKDTSKDAKK